MKQLPVLLEPWRPWLSLFPPDLADPLGQILLRLHRQIGPLRSTPARADALPEGVGSIVQRGPYERLLISEWAYADAEPDEFIRRAANGELMFTGPEPAARRRSRRCVALFDAGPAQLGEARLLHLALFILLARRAEEAGAVFEWAVLQDRHELASQGGMEGIKSLLKARTLQGPDTAAMAGWAAAVDSDTDDVWIIGAHGLKAPFPVRGQVAIRRSMLSEQLDVSLTLHKATRSFSLELPLPELSIRLLRRPFEPLALQGAVRQPNGRPSIKQAPRFSTTGMSLAVPQLDGGVVVYHVPSSLRNAPGKPRVHPRAAGANVLSVSVFGKSMASITSEGDTLRFKGFPFEAFASKSATCARPLPEKFRAPPQMGRWLPTFFIRRAVRSASPSEKWEDAHVLALDVAKHLVCWSRRSTTQAGTVSNGAITFRTIANLVVGADQSDQTLVYACAGTNSTRLFVWRPNRETVELPSLQRTAMRVIFGDMSQWPLSEHLHGLLALQSDDTEWWVGNYSEGVPISILDRAKVLGVASSGLHSIYGLVVLSPNKMTIELRTRFASRILVRSAEPIAQAAVCPRTGKIAWIGTHSGTVSVQGLDEEKPFLRVLMEEAVHAQ